MTIPQRIQRSRPKGLITWRNIAKQAGVCMTCALGAPEPFGCTDCLNTGWDGGAPAGFVSEAHVTALQTENAKLREVLIEVRDFIDGQRPPLPNQAMSLAGLIDAVLAKAEDQP